MARGTRARNHAVAVADHVGCGAGTDSWVIRRRGRVAVCTIEPARTTVDARGDAINWVITVRRRIVSNLN